MDYELSFEWDEEKAEKNFKKHGVLFKSARRVFLDKRRIVSLDNRRDYGEERFNTVGLFYTVLLHITYTMRGKNVRIISARKANAKEIKKYVNQNND